MGLSKTPAAFMSGSAPLYLFGNASELVYINNPKAGCTLAQNMLFFANHGYMYPRPIDIHASKYAFWRLGGTPAIANADALHRLQSSQPLVFSFVRNPLRRIVSAFHSKLMSQDDDIFGDLRDDLTCRANIDLSPTCDRRKSITAFCRWLLDYMDRPYWIDAHFRPQAYNLYPEGDPSAQYIIGDLVIKLEDHEILEEFVERHAPGFDQSPQLYNKSADLDHSEYLSDDLVALSHRLFEIDYRLFSYEA